jgi:hypothetical protein
MKEILKSNVFVINIIYSILKALKDDLENDSINPIDNEEEQDENLMPHGLENQFDFSKLEIDNNIHQNVEEYININHEILNDLNKEIIQIS